MTMSDASDAFLIDNTDDLAALPQGPERIRRASKPDFFRDPKNYFGMTVTDVADTIGPHWHPNADEFDYFLKGEGIVGIVDPVVPPTDPLTAVHEFQVKAGDLIVIPQGYAHYYVNCGGADNLLQFLAVFNNPDFRVINTYDVPGKKAVPVKRRCGSHPPK